MIVLSKKCINKKYKIIKYSCTDIKISETPYINHIKNIYFCFCCLLQHNGAQFMHNEPCKFFDVLSMTIYIFLIYNILGNINSKFNIY